MAQSSEATHQYVSRQDVGHVQPFDKQTRMGVGEKTDGIVVVGERRGNPYRGIRHVVLVGHDLS